MSNDRYISNFGKYYLSNDFFYQLDTLQLTQEKETNSIAQCFTGWFKKNFLECRMPQNSTQFE